MIDREKAARAFERREVSFPKQRECEMEDRAEIASEQMGGKSEWEYAHAILCIDGFLGSTAPLRSTSSWSVFIYFVAKEELHTIVCVIYSRLIFHPIAPWH
jgi:hypothetical protein